MCQIKLFISLYFIASFLAVSSITDASFSEENILSRRQTTPYLSSTESAPRLTAGKDAGVEKMLETIADHFIKEQHHAQNSTYFFDRKDCPESDTLPFGGYGRPVNFTGMTWSGFRPSDDACVFNYLVPSNMMAVVAMRYAEKLARDGFNNEILEML